jgi:hypothetical protein
VQGPFELCCLRSTDAMLTHALQPPTEVTSHAVLKECSHPTIAFFKTYMAFAEFQRHAMIFCSKPHLPAQSKLLCSNALCTTHSCTSHSATTAAPTIQSATPKGVWCCNRAAKQRHMPMHGTAADGCDRNTLLASWSVAGTV